MKKCTKCGIEKDESEFSIRKDRKNGKALRSQCKKCSCEDSKKWLSKNGDRKTEYRKSKKELIDQQNKEYRESHREEHRIASLNWYYKNKERSRNNSRNWQRSHRDYYDQPQVKIAKNLRTRMSKAIKEQSGKKVHLVEIIGCTIPELRKHLENQFKPGMTWENYGLKGWTIDHICPCTLFDLTDHEQQKACFHYTNLQPLWEWENSSKKNRFTAA